MPRTRPTERDEILVSAAGSLVTAAGRGDPWDSPRSGARGPGVKRPRTGLAVAAVLLLAPAAGCDGGGTERVPLDGGMETQEVVEALPPEIQAQLDSANAAYRAHDYEGALAHFGEVTELEPGLAAGWYGLGMTHRVMGNAEAADSAMMRAHRLAPEVPLDHPAPSAPPNPHPPSR